MINKDKRIRKEVMLDKPTIDILSSMALTEGRSLKNFMERSLEFISLGKVIPGAGLVATVVPQVKEDVPVPAKPVGKIVTPEVPESPAPREEPAKPIKSKKAEPPAKREDIIKDLPVDIQKTFKDPMTTDPPKRDTVEPWETGTPVPRRTTMWKDGKLVYKDTWEPVD